MATLTHLSATLSPFVEALLRVIAGLLLVPHGLRMSFGFFPGTGMPVNSLAKLAAALDSKGYRPGRLWAPVISATELIAGPLFAVGLFTQLAAVPIFILLAASIVDHKRDGWFWNTLGVEYPILWTAAVLYFLVNGGGPISLDALLGLPS